MFSYAQNYEDVYIFRAFRDVEKGFYVDIGAYDPMQDSVTKIFYDRGWTGINVEPGPIFGKLQSARQRDVNLQLAVSDRDGEGDFYVHEGEPGTSTLVEALDPHLRDRVPVRHKSRVPLTTLSRLLETHAPGRHIHFLKLDVEGAEEAIIRTTDWRRYRPELLVVEATVPYSHERRDDAWNEILSEAGYHLVFFDGINAYYLREESLHRKGAFGLPVNVLDYVQKYEHETQQRISRLEFERSILLHQLRKSTAQLDTNAAERAALIRDLRFPGAPRSLATGLAIGRLLRRTVAAVRSPASLRGFGSALRSRLSGAAAQPRLTRKKPLPAPVEEALLTLALRSDGPASAPRALFEPRRRSARLASAAENELRSLALRHAKGRVQAADGPP